MYSDRIDWTDYENSTLFYGVDFEAIETQLEASEVITIADGEILIDPEEINAYLYLLLDGCLKVHLGTVENEAIALLEPGDCVGELSALSNVNSSAIVVACEACQLLKVRDVILWSMIDASHALARNLLYILSGHIRKSNTRLLDNLRNQRELEQHAVIDALTGLHNRRWLNEILPRHFIRSQKENKVFSLVMLDIDKFKLFNDQHGHLAGDEVLRALSRLIQSYLRPMDMAARYGGEEFLLVLNDVAAERAINIAERLRINIENASVRFEDSVLHVTASMGIAESTAADNVLDVIKLADRALYQAKENGRNRIEII